jgi:hypothetical protein
MASSLLNPADGGFMKIIVTGIALLMLFVPKSFADTPLSLRQHMAAMGYILDEVWVKTANPSEYLYAADKVREMRGHLVASIDLFPSKFSTLNPFERRLAEIEYHHFMARVIYLSSTLESTLLKPNMQPVGPSRESDIKQLLGEISTAVGRAHGKFR